MKQLIYYPIIFLFSLFSLNCMSQSNDSFQMKRNFWGFYKYSINNETIDKQRAQGIISKNNDANTVIKKGKQLMLYGDILSGTGGFLIGYSLFNDSTSDTPLLIAAVGLNIAAFILMTKGNKSIKEGVQLINTSGFSSSIYLQPKSEYFTIGTSSNGLGLHFKF